MNSEQKNNQKDRQPSDRCSGCGQRSSCGSVYQKLGAAKGPSVLGLSLIAFLLPIVQFLLALAVIEWFLRAWIADQDLRWLAGILPALLVSVCGITIVRWALKFKVEYIRQGEPSSRPKI
ncbi:MAG: SoxR reducing system RseC family protein [Phycisphaerae bacterium]|nr:SoxR reducing system RseC family protein [Phycisphaerae bacterium]